MIQDTAQGCTPCPVSSPRTAPCYSRATFALRGQLATTFPQPRHGTGKTRQALRWHPLRLHLHICTRAFLLSLPPRRKGNVAGKASPSPAPRGGEDAAGTGLLQPTRFRGGIQYREKANYTYGSTPEQLDAPLHLHICSSPQAAGCSATFPDQLPPVTQW